MTIPPRESALAHSPPHAQEIAQTGSVGENEDDKQGDQQEGFEEETGRGSLGK